MKMIFLILFIIFNVIFNTSISKLSKKQVINNDKIEPENEEKPANANKTISPFLKKNKYHEENEQENLPKVPELKKTFSNQSAVEINYENEGEDK